MAEKIQQKLFRLLPLPTLLLLLLLLAPPLH